jgi:hypothetical protein
MGRASFFRGKIKSSKYRVQGLLTRVGRRLFEARRREFCRLVGMKEASDADVIEYLARGHDDTLLYMEKGSR